LPISSEQERSDCFYWRNNRQEKTVAALLF